jgi:acetate kinase
MKNRRILILNAGSSSLKYALFDRTAQLVFRGSYENIRPGGYPGKLKDIVRLLMAAGESLGDIALVGHRVVHGGHFREATLLSERSEQYLHGLVPLAPLHQKTDVEIIRLARKFFPEAKQAAAFDTAFFADLPDEAANYAIPQAVAKRYGIRRYGFHGLSHEWAMYQAALALKKPVSRLKLITLHLGSGASAAAIDRGQPIDTSMGLTPLEGLVMSTRSGDIDSGVIFHLARAGWTIRRIEELLTKKSGWYGVSGQADFRTVLAAAGIRTPGWRATTANKADRLRSGLAVDLAVHRIVKYLGAYQALLGGADALVCTGTIGSGNAAFRRILRDWVRPMGIAKIVVVASDEEALIARAVSRFLK